MLYPTDKNDSKRKSLGPPSLLLCDANTFADVLGVSPSYRQKEFQRWNSAMNIYTRLSSQDLTKINRHDYADNVSSSEHRVEMSAPVSTIVSPIYTPPIVPCKGSGKRYSAPSPLEPRFLFNVRCNKDIQSSRRGSVNLASIARNRVIHVSTIVDEDENLFDGQRRCASSFDLDDLAAAYNRGHDSRGHSAEVTDIENGSSLNALELEAIAAVHELQFAVRDIFVSELLPRTGEIIFLNVTTLEGQPFCVELTVKGWRVTALRHDYMNGDLCFIDLHTRYFETVYALMDTISASYKQTFSNALTQKLQTLLLTAAADDQNVDVDGHCRVAEHDGGGAKVLFEVGKEQ